MAGRCKPVLLVTNKQAFKKGIRLSEVKSPQEEEKKKKEMKYTLAFHAEGKNP